MQRHKYWPGVIRGCDAKMARAELAVTNARIDCAAAEARVARADTEIARADEELLRVMKDLGMTFGDEILLRAKMKDGYKIGLDELQLMIQNQKVAEAVSLGMIRQAVLALPVAMSG